MTFVLKNGNKIDEEGLGDAFGDAEPARVYFLDLETGEVGCIEKGEGKKIPVSNRERYVEVPHTLASRQIEWLRDFARELIVPEGGSAFADKLFKILDSPLLGNDSLKLSECLEILEKDPSGWIHGWAEWHRDHSCEAMSDWLMKLPIEIEDKFEAFDDCELCKLIEKGPHNLGDFMEAKQKDERKKNHGKK